MTQYPSAVPIACQYCELEYQSNWRFEEARAGLDPISTFSNASAAVDNPRRHNPGNKCEVRGLTGKDIYHTLARYLVSCENLTLLRDGECQIIDIPLGRDPTSSCNRFIRLELDIISGMEVFKHAMNNAILLDWNGVI